MATDIKTIQADVLIHVLDVSNPARNLHYQAVREVLEELGVAEKPCILALNKIDLLNEEELRRVSEHFPLGIPISAKEKLNLDQLLTAIFGSLNDKDSKSHDASHCALN